MNFKAVYTILLLLLFQNLDARIIFVDQDAAGANNGSSWENAFIKLDHALNIANYGDSIWVKEGHYLNYDGPFILNNGVKLFGGFKGDEYDLSDRKTEFNHSKLTALRHGVLCINSDSTTKIDGFTLFGNSAYPNKSIHIHCEIEEGDTRCYGGGIFVGSWEPDQPACLKIENCIFEENEAQNAGGALILYSHGKSGLWVSNTIFRKNKSLNSEGGGLGGALYLTASASEQYGFYFEDCLFEENEAVWYGGVVTSQGDWDVEFKNCIFQNNKAKRRSAALAKSSVSISKRMLIKNCQFINNRTEPSRFWPGQGGAIFGEKLQIENCLFSGNIARWGGAIQGTDLIISNTSFLNNYAGMYGGAIDHLTYGNSDNMKHHSYINCTFSGNRADTTGGAVRASSVSRDTFINCIFYNNSAGLAGNNIHYWNNIKSLHFSDYNYFDTEDTLGAIWNIFENQDSMQIGSNTIFGGLNPRIGIGYDGLLWPGDCSPLRGLGDPNITLSHDMAGVERPTNRPSTIGALEPEDWIYEWKYRDETCYGYQDGAIWMEHSHKLGPIQFSVEDLNQGFDTLFLHQGNYTVIAMDQAECIVDTVVTIYGRAEIIVQDSIVHASGQEMADGAIEILNISGDYPPFEVKWDDGKTGQSIMGLVPGEYQATITDDIGCEKVISYVIDFSNSIQIVQDIGVAIYPNPARDVLWIDIRNAHKPIESIRLLHMMGGLVHEESPSQTPDLLYSLDLRSLQSGMYLIQIRWDGGQTVAKLVVE